MFPGDNLSSQLEIRMLQYLSHKFATKHRISIERLVSGNGLANVSVCFIFLVVLFSSL